MGIPSALREAMMEPRSRGDVRWLLVVTAAVWALIWWVW